LQIEDLNFKKITRSSIQYCYDIETFQNYFCIAFYNGKTLFQYEIGLGINQLQEIKDFVQGKLLFGYNNFRFDDVVLNYLLTIDEKNHKDLPYNIWDLAQRTIKSMDGVKDNEVTKLKYLQKPYESIDLMKAASMQKSLKLVGISMKWKNIQDMPIHYTSILTKEQTKELKEYNFNDVAMTLELANRMQKDLEFRWNLSQKYQINAYSKSESEIGSELFCKLYEEKLDYDELEIYREKRTHRARVDLIDCIFPHIQFKSKIFNDLLSEIKLMQLLKKDKGFEYKFPEVEYKGVKFQLGIGGLHSIDSPGKFYSTDTEDIIDIDGTSYYPNTMLNNRVKPYHLDERFLEVLNQITQDRILAKKNKDKITADTLKLVINRVFGQLGFEGDFLYDEKAMIEVTINGQLQLLMLVEMLFEKGFEIISANTDGITCKIQKNRKDIFKLVCKEWESICKIELEETYYKKYIRRDVNNYICEKEDGSLKFKGRFSIDIPLRAGYDMPIIAIALKQYFIDGISVEKSIREHKDIYDFCSSQKMGKQFTAYYDGKEVQNSLRFFVSKNGKKLVKVKYESTKETNSISEFCAGKLTTLFNKFYESNDYNLDYNYYIQEVQKIISLINKSDNFLF